MGGKGRRTERRGQFRRIWTRASELWAHASAKPARCSPLDILNILTEGKEKRPAPGSHRGVGRSALGLMTLVTFVHRVRARMNARRTRTMIPARRQPRVLCSPQFRNGKSTSSPRTRPARAGGSAPGKKKVAIISKARPRFLVDHISRRRLLFMMRWTRSQLALCI